METPVALAFGSVADKKNDGIFQWNKFLIADCEATGTWVEIMRVNDVIYGGFFCNIRVYSCRIVLLEFSLFLSVKKK